MAQAGLTWQVTPEQAFSQLFDEYARVIFQSGNRVAHKRAEEMEVWGRANASWQDQTGDARKLLSVRVEGDEFGIGTIIVEHGVDYGLWLEIAHAGKYAIITRMIDVFAPVLWRDLQRIMNLGLAAK